MAAMVGQLAGNILHGSGKVLVVCTEGCDDVQRNLMSNGCSVAMVRDGGGAVARATREAFDVAVVLSTGMDMDLAETVLNLRDVNGSMQIVIVADRVGTGKSMISNLAHAVPNTAVLTLQSLFDSLRNGPVAK